MGWFNFSSTPEPKTESDLVLYAPLTGTLFLIDDVPDVLFSEKIVGDGVAIKPTEKKLVSPCDGVVAEVFETNHAIVLKTTPYDLEIFIHIGIDTVDLNGSGFIAKVKEGDIVHVGDELIEFNLNLIQNKAKSSISPILISAGNMPKVKKLTQLFTSPKCIAGQTQILGIDFIADIESKKRK